MIELYNKNNKRYNRHGNIILTPASCTIKMELNGVCGVELTHPKDKEGLYNYIKVDTVIAAYAPWSENKQLFRIYEVVNTLNEVSAYGRHIFFDLAGVTLIDVRPTNKNCQEALNNVLEGTDFTGKSNIQKSETAYYIRTPITTAICGNEENSFINRWGGERLYDNHKVIINDRIGSDKGVMIAYRKNLISITEKISMEDVVTQIIPVGFDGITTINNLTVKSPYYYTYPRRYDKVIKFEHIKYDPENKDGNAYTSLAAAQTALYNEAKELMKTGIDTPTATYTVEMAVIKNDGLEVMEVVDIGDTVKIRHTEMGIDLTTRCIAIEWDAIKKKYLRLTLNTPIKNFYDGVTSANNRLDKILTTGGDVNGLSITGAIDGFKAALKAQRNIEHPQQARAILFEDKIAGSPTYGAMSLGTMGFAIAKDMLPDGSWDWRTFGTGQGFMADLIVAGKIIGQMFELDLNSGTVLMGKRNAAGVITDPVFKVFLDGTTAQLALKGDLYQKNNSGYPGMYFSNSKIKVFSLNTSGATTGIIGYCTFDGNESMGLMSPNGKPLVIGKLTAENGSTITGTSRLVVMDDSVDVWGKLKMMGNSWVDLYNNGAYSGAVIGAAAGKACVTGGSEVMFNLGNVLSNTWKASIKNDGLSVNGSITCSGTKPRTVKTENYGWRQLHAYETPMPYFGDIGEGVINAEGICTVVLDPIFYETIEVDYAYQVFTQKYTAGEISHIKRLKDLFIVYGTPGLSFAWEIKAVQKGYSDSRFVRNFDFDAHKNFNVLSEDYVPVNYDDIAHAYLNNFERNLYDEKSNGNHTAPDR